MIDNFRGKSGTRRQSLETRLNAVADGITIPDLPASDPDTSDGYPASSALRIAYAAFNKAIVGYTTLRIIALRFRDSPVTGEENTADVADQNMRDLVDVVHTISQLLHDVVVDELEHDGHNCVCTCACCGLGVCICATNNRETLSNAWSGAGPFADEGEVFVLPPRSDIPAAAAGLQHGDFIVAADGKELDTYMTLYDVADGCQSGETIELRVRRASGELTDISVVRS